MKITNKQINKANTDINKLLNQYKNRPVSELFQKYDINPKSKGKMKSLTTALINESQNESLIEFISHENVWVKTVNLVRNGKVEASLSLPSFSFCEIVNEQWESSKLRDLLDNTIFIFVFFEEETYEKKKEKYIHSARIWRMPKEVIDSGVKDCWQKVVNCLVEGRVVKYVGEDGRYHTYFPRTSDNPYVHVRPHAASMKSTLPLPVRDKLTGLEEYPMHSFWITRNYIEKILYKGEAK